MLKPDMDNMSESVTDIESDILSNSAAQYIEMEGLTLKRNGFSLDLSSNIELPILFVSDNTLALIYQP